MDFFEHQELARRNTKRLVFYFILAVLLIIAAVYFAVMLTLVGIHAKTGSGAQALQLWHPQIFLITAVGTLLLVTAGSTYKIHALASGGDAVARMFGARKVNPATQDLDERRLLNVVEEMAIAAGTAVPPVYLLDDEDGINAFAAGYAPDDAIIAVTRGCLQVLSRDELQGVIAHEFSHVLNGDMRLNIRLIGILNGILLISLVGYFVFRSIALAGNRSSRRRGSREGGGGAILAILALGILLMIIGYVGVFFGRLIKSALSRQREFLADASAVQFTRHPDSIAGALKKIGGLAAGSHVRHPQAEAASHMFFENAMGHAFLGLLATHPPLDERIRRLDPSFDGQYPRVTIERDHPPLTEQYPGTQAATETPWTTETTGGGLDTEEMLAITPAVLLAQVGTPQPRHLEYARQLRESIPTAIRNALHDPFSARAVVYGLLLDSSPQVRRSQLHILETQADPAVYRATINLMDAFQQITPRHRLPLLDMAIPTLQTLSAQQYTVFRQNITALVEADQEISLFEYALQHALTRNLDAHFGGQRPTAVQYYSLKPLKQETEILLATLARAGETSSDSAKKAFHTAAARLQSQLPGLQFADKRLLIEAATLCIAADQQITVEEAELLRVIADSLGSPMPPLLPGESLAGAN
jgi:Zn-dependent protease with chaperone function